MLRTRKTAIAAKLVMTLIVMTIAVFPQHLRCMTTSMAASDETASVLRAPMTVAMSLEVLTQEDNICHAHRIVPWNSSWVVRTGPPLAIMPNPTLTIPLAAIAFLFLARRLASPSPAGIAHRMRFLSWIWSASMPFAGSARHIPYLRAQRAP